MRLKVIVGVMLIFAVNAAEAKQQRTDAEWKRALLGWWIVPPDSTDATPQNIKAVENFRGDGTYLDYFYADHICGKVIQTERVSWDVTDGVLTSVVLNGSVMRDEIVSIEGRILTLHSLDDGSTYTRKKIVPCAAAVS